MYTRPAVIAHLSLCRSPPAQPVFIKPPLASAIRSSLYHRHLPCPAQTHIKQPWLPGTTRRKHHHASNCNPNNRLLIHTQCLHDFREEHQRIHRRRRRRVNLFAKTKTNQIKSKATTTTTIMGAVVSCVRRSAPPVFFPVLRMPY